MSGRDLRNRMEEAARYERKYVAKGACRGEAELYLKLHPALFREIYHPRHVNNIYFDTYDLADYADTLAGVQKRTKTRIRWYGDLFGFAESPALELKHKHGLVGWKESFVLAGFHMEEVFQPAVLREALTASQLPSQVAARATSVEPSLVNRYLRSYYLSACGRFRVTLDSGLEFHALPSPGGRFAFNHVEETVVLELKYEKQHDADAPRIGSFFPFGLSRFSKYTSGIAALDPS